MTKVESLAEVIGAQSIQDPNLLKSCAACILEVLNERSERVAARRNYSEEDEYVLSSPRSLCWYLDVEGCVLVDTRWSCCQNAMI